MATLVKDPMAKKASSSEGAPEKSSKKTTMKVAVELNRKAKMVALHRNIDVFDYIESILLPAVERDFAQMIQQESQRPKK